MESKLLKSAILRTSNILRPFPTLFYFPGIRSFPIWENMKDEIKSIKLLEDNYKAIREEYLQVLLEKAPENYKFTDHEKSLHKGDWEWYSYISKGTKNQNFINNFPFTNSLLDKITDIGEIMYDLPFSYTFFSRLSPLSSIAPHYGPCNIRLRIHLGIDIPQNCFIKVANQERYWEEGKCIIFDDTYSHEVKNESTNFRTILLLDIWHPDIYFNERQSMTLMFKEAYDKGWLKK